MSIEIRIEIPYQAFPEWNLKALITLEQVNTSVVEKKNDLNEQNSWGLLEDQDRGSGIGDQVKKLDIQ